MGIGTLNLKSSTTTASADVVPPPGIGLFTVTLRVPLCAKSLAGRVAVSNVELERVVERELPLTKTLELVLKFVPVTVRVTAALPADTVEGERLLAPGIGLLMVKVVTRDGLPPGFVTVTNGVPATAMALAGIAACNLVESLLNADETVLELKVTTELAVNPVPVSKRVNAGLPAVVLAGIKAPITGCVFVARTFRVTEGEVPPGLPPPTGSVTEILIAR